MMIKQLGFQNRMVFKTALPTKQPGLQNSPASKTTRHTKQPGLQNSPAYKTARLTKQPGLQNSPAYKTARPTKQPGLQNSPTYKTARPMNQTKLIIKAYGCVFGLYDFHLILTSVNHTMQLQIIKNMPWCHPRPRCLSSLGSGCVQLH